MNVYSGYQKIHVTKTTTLLMFLSLCYFVLTTLTGVDGWTYHISSKPMIWEEARRWCKTNYADLVVIRSHEENAYLNNSLPERDENYWIGIRKNNNNIWTWVATNELLLENESNWATNEPNNYNNNEACVEMYVKRLHGTGKWNDYSCQRSKTALCYKASCEPDSCSGKGKCVEAINSTKCECSPGYYGSGVKAVKIHTVFDAVANVVGCEEVGHPSQGFISCSPPSGNFSYGTECKFGCEEGYQLVGSKVIQCTAEREWSAVPPRCEVVQCRELESPVHGSIHCTHPLSNFSYTTECDFQCAEGFELISSSKLLCGPCGQWNGSQPECTASCEPDSCSGKGKCVEAINSTKCECSPGYYGERCESVVGCEEVGHPSQGFISCYNSSGNFSYGTECKFGCEEGYQLVGSKVIQCTAEREWSAVPPRCEAHPKPALSTEVVAAAAGGGTVCLYITIWLSRRRRKMWKATVFFNT